MSDARRNGKTHFGQLIALKRHEVGLSQRDLAEAAGVDGSAISRLESGDRKCDPETAIALADAFGGSASDWLGVYTRALAGEVFSSQDLDRVLSPSPSTQELPSVASRLLTNLEIAKAFDPTLNGNQGESRIEAFNRRQLTPLGYLLRAYVAKKNGKIERPPTTIQPGKKVVLSPEEQFKLPLNVFVSFAPVTGSIGYSLKMLGCVEMQPGANETPSICLLNASDDVVEIKPLDLFAEAKFWLNEYASASEREIDDLYASTGEPSSKLRVVPD
ncbi:MAG: helix-turn-helix domain-containing protein [Pseudomonadota bacterium]